MLVFKKTVFKGFIFLSRYSTSNSNTFTSVTCCGRKLILLFHFIITITGKSCGKKIVLLLNREVMIIQTKNSFRNRTRKSYIFQCSTYVKRFPRHLIWFISLPCTKYHGTLARHKFTNKDIDCVLKIIITNILLCCACILPYK